jgi:hypothetical protein
MAEVTWDPRLWDEVLYPIYKDFADLWALRVLPGRMDSKVKAYIKEMVQRYSRITEIHCVTKKRLQQLASQRLLSSSGSVPESTRDEFDCAALFDRFLG